MKQALDDRFPGKIEITGEAIPGMSGKFEVELEDGQVLHSKIDGGGYVDTPAKLDKIAKGIGTCCCYAVNVNCLIFLAHGHVRV